jgi:excisionase family DNA binding protein
MNGATDSSFTDQFNRELWEVKQRLHCVGTFDVLFLCFLRRVARFGFFTLGPITIDVRLIEDLVERTVEPAASDAAPDDFIRFSQLLMAEVRRSGRTRIDELHYLFAFMRCDEGLPGRVFGELGLTPEQVEASLRAGTGGAAVPERLLSPEEVAAYLQVHVQTVRAWIRSGRLPARRVAGLRALRVRFTDVTALLQPVEAETLDGG